MQMNKDNNTINRKFGKMYKLRTKINPMNLNELKERWINILRQKATHEHNLRKNGEIVASPSIDDICNEMEAFFTGLDNNQ